MPIPKGLKVKNKPGSFSGGEDEDSQFGEDDYGIDEDDTMDSNSSSANQNQVRRIIICGGLKNIVLGLFGKFLMN